MNLEKNREADALAERFRTEWRNGLPKQQGESQASDPPPVSMAASTQQTAAPAAPKVLLKRLRRIKPLYNERPPEGSFRAPLAPKAAAATNGS